MKKLLYVLTGLCLLAGLFTACEKPNATSEGDDDTTTKNYTEMVFGMNLEMVYVAGGEFEMGATAEQGDDAKDNEKPVRTVKLDGYHIGKYEVTQAQWQAVMGQKDYVFATGDDYPVYYVSWEEAQEFCKKMSEATGRMYVLPTEAQWEYAARGGSKSQHYKYAGSNDPDEVAWYDENDHSLHPVGNKKANELGIYDMSGNVMEWCSDWYGDYNEKDTENPLGSLRGFRRVIRDGSFILNVVYCRVSCRYSNYPGNRRNDLGFRVVCIAE